MKTIIAAIAALAALTGCAVPQQPGYYATTQVQDPYQWHTVAVTPSSGGAPSGTWTEELPPQSTRTTTYVATQPAYTTYVSQPVYYAPAPVYYAPSPSYYYPPVSIGLDFVFSNRGWGGGHRGGWGGRGGYHRR